MFRIAVMTYRALNGSALAYLSSYFTRVADVPSRQRLRSASFNLNLLYRRAAVQPQPQTSLPSANGLLRFPAPASGTVFHHTWHMYRRSRYSDCKSDDQVRMSQTKQKCLKTLSESDSVLRHFCFVCHIRTWSSDLLTALFNCVQVLLFRPH